jgi:NTP pyrophosphatase (non-canonical NTP hydrolase)
MNSLTEFSKKVHQDNVDKGFYDTEVSIGTQLMLITSELAEALEADRHRITANKFSFSEEFSSTGNFKSAFKNHIKDSYEDEIADALIRILDHCGYKGIDIEWHVQQKLKYNRTRENRHGKVY